jgi:hypothetical protein
LDYLSSGILVPSTLATTDSFHLAALHQAGFEDPFLGPPTHSCENIPLAFELYEIKISVAASMPSYIGILLSVGT